MLLSRIKWNGLKHKHLKRFDPDDLRRLTYCIPGLSESEENYIETQTQLLLNTKLTSSEENKKRCEDILLSEEFEVPASQLQHINCHVKADRLRLLLDQNTVQDKNVRISSFKLLNTHMDSIKRPYAFQCVARRIQFITEKNLSSKAAVEFLKPKISTKVFKNVVSDTQEIMMIRHQASILKFKDLIRHQPSDLGDIRRNINAKIPSKAIHASSSDPFFLISPINAIRNVYIFREIMNIGELDIHLVIYVHLMLKNDF
jgi:hypothetical protein